MPAIQLQAGARLRAQLATRHLRLPILGNDDETANHSYIKHFVLDLDSLHQRGVLSDKEVGAPYGFEWAERFRYIGSYESRLEDYISKSAVPIYSNAR